jgi:hypothetical protein
VGAGRVAEVLGGRPASREAADAAFAAGHNVLVFPGGDVDAGKSWRDRNRVQFDARCGFARVEAAMQARLNELVANRKPLVG